MDMNTIGNRIKMLRKTKKMNQEELSEVLGISTRTMSMMENDESDPSAKQISKLSSFFNVSISYLMTGEEEEKTISETEQEIIQLVRKDVDIKETLLKLLDTKKKAINRMMMHSEMMAA